MKLLFVLLLFIIGCATPFNSLEGRIPDRHYARDYNKTVESLKAHYFSEEAQKIIKDIPCVDGMTMSGSYVVGANFWGTFIGVLTGSGFSPKCVMNEKAMQSYGPEGIIHEYIHHVEHLVDQKAFEKAYIRMSKDSRWYGLVRYTEPKADRWVTNTFGISKYSEWIAYMGAKMADEQSGPGYMWDVLEVILKRP